MSVRALDEKDLHVLQLLRQNAKFTTQQIAKRLLMPVTTVHNRIKKLERLGVITGYTARMDWGKLGKALNAFVLITVDYHLLRQRGITQRDIVQRLERFEDVEEAQMVAGGTDIVARVRVADIEQLSRFVTKQIQSVDGVEKTQTMVVLPAA